MIYGLILLIIAFVSAIGAARIEDWGLVLIWPAMAYAAIGAGYCGLGPAVFGKGTNGKTSPIALVVLFPYLLPVWAIWHVWRILFGTPASVQLSEKVSFGRRLLPNEFPVPVTVVVDLTCEFYRSRPPGSGTGYLCLPTIDGQTPHYDDLLEVVTRIARSTRPTYFHCANGRGRTALVAASLLLVLGQASDAETALAAIRELRPGARLSGSQRRMLERVAAEAPPLTLETA